MQKIINNISWLSSDYIIKATVGSILIIVIANSIGAEAFGIYSLILSIFGVVLVISSLGLNSVCIKYIANNSIEKSFIISSSLVILFLGAISISLIAILASLFFSDLEEYRLIIFIYAFASLFNITKTYSFYFEGKAQQKYNVIASLLSFLIFAIFKLVVVLNELSIIWLYSSIALEFILQGILLSIFYFKFFNKNIFGYINVKVLKDLLLESLPYWITASIVMINIRIDQYFLALLMDLQSVAIYSVAARFAEFLWIIPIVISKSIFPTLTKIFDEDLSKDYFHKYLEGYLCFVVLICFCFATTLFFLSEFLIGTFFTSDFALSASVLGILSFSVIPVAMGTVGSQFIVLKKIGNYSLIRSVVALLSNVMLNIILIPRFGVEGAAIALLLSQLISSFLIDFFSNEMKRIFFAKIKALNPLWLVKNAISFFNKIPQKENLINTK